MIKFEDIRGRLSSPNAEELRTKLDTLVRNSNHLSVSTASQKEDDGLSHWILALAFSANEESRKRFINFEVELFKLRFFQLSPLQVQEFVSGPEVGYERVPDLNAFIREDGTNPLEDVFRAQYNSKNQVFSKTVFYQMDFTLVCDLVRSRRVYVHKGKAFVPQTEVISALASLFKSKLMEKMVVASRSLHFIAKDERMGPLVTKFQKASVNSLGSDLALSNGTLGEVKVSDIPLLAKRSFPLCARELEHALSTPSVPRFMNDSRQQFILFLKGIGLKMEDCLVYFQQEFQRKNVGADEFKKRGYVYTVQHNYGQVGKRANYAPWSCVKAISHSRSTSEQVHGCTFKELSPEKLALFLTKSGGVQDQAGMKKILDLHKAGSFQLACRAHWELLHPGGNSEPVGNHPNAWFDASMRYYEEKKVGGGAKDVVVESATTTTNSEG